MVTTNEQVPDVKVEAPHGDQAQTHGAGEPAAAAHSHEGRVCRANWRPGTDTLSPFLDRVCRL
jgi:hypothetical protein